MELFCKIIHGFQPLILVITTWSNSSIKAIEKRQLFSLQKLYCWLLTSIHNPTIYAKKVIRIRKFGIYTQHVPYSVLIILAVNLFFIYVQPCQDTSTNFRKTQCEDMGTVYYEDKLLNWTFNKNMSGMSFNTVFFQNVFMIFIGTIHLVHAQIFPKN